jgi:TonB-dependent receptor
MQQSISAPLSGSVRGRVFDRATGDPLPGANVTIQNTSIGASTDLDGRFNLRSVPEGVQTIRVTYVGYVTATAEVTVSPDTVLERDFRLAAQAILGETVVVTAQAQGQNAAINQQLSSNTITSIVSAARIKELPDVNAAESIGRLPGVSINRSGGEANTVTIRGLSAKYNVVTVDGVRLPSTGDDRGTSLTSSVANNGSPDARSGGNDRSADLSLISSNMLDGIELKKANTPDMDADVLGGTVDLRLREAPDTLAINASAQGGYNQLQKYYGNYNLGGSLSNRFFDGDLGVIATANVDSYDRSADKFAGGYNQQGTTAWRINSLDMREEKVTRGRTGGSLLFDYRIPNGKITTNLFYNRLHWDGTYRINSMNIDHNSHYYDTEQRNGKTDLFTGALGVKQDYGWIRFDAGADRTGSWERNPNERTWRFAQENGAFNPVNPDSNTNPNVVPLAQKVDTSGTGLADMYVFDTKRDERQTTVQANVSVPFRLGELVSGYVKAGGKYRLLDRRNDEEVSGINGLQYGSGGTGINNQLSSILQQLAAKYPGEWNYARDSATVRQRGVFPVSLFLTDYSRSNFLNGEFPLGLGINTSKLNELTNALIEVPSVYQRYTIQSDGRDYDGTEEYQAGYIMGEFNLTEYVTLLPGVRWEKEFSRYHGERYRAVTIGGSHQSPPLDFTPITADRHFEFWLPMVHLTVKPFDWLKVRLARTQTLTRPDYRQYAPITYITSLQDQIVAANLSLKPAQSTNYDAAVSVYENSVGLVTVSGFYKKITDLIFSTRYNLAPGIPAPPGSDIPAGWLASNAPIYSYAMNNPYPATVKGFELEWQTHFWYLPSILQGLVLNVNYTRVYSQVDVHQYFLNRVQVLKVPPVFRYIIVDSSRSSRVPGQPANIANVTLGYDIMGFSARLSFLYQSDIQTGISTAGSLDSYTADYARWDLTLLQRLDWGLEIFANLSNLNARPDKNLASYRETQPTYIEYYGFTMDLGIRFRL